MTVRAELQFVTDAARVASEAAADVMRLRVALDSLGSMSGMRVDVGANMSAQIDAAAASATRLAAVLSQAATDAKRIGSQIGGRTTPDAARERATARAADAKQKSELKIGEIQKQNEARLAEIRAKNEARLSEIAAKGKLQAERDARKAAERNARKPLPVTEETTSGVGGAARAILEGQGLKGALGALGGRGAVAGAIIDLGIRAVDVVTDLSVSFGKAVVKAQAYKEDVAEAFKTVERARLSQENATKGLGKDGLALTQEAERSSAKLLSMSNTIADNLGIARAQVSEQFLDLTTKGFDPDTTKRVIGALADLGTIDRRAGSEAGREGLTKVIGKIAATGRINLEALSELNTFGLEQGDVMTEIGKMLGKNDKEVLRLLSSSGGIRGLGVEPILQAIAKQVGGGPAGAAAAAKADRNLSSLLQRIENIPSDILFDVQTGPGIDSIKGFIRDVLDFFRSGTDTGDRTRKVVGDLFNALTEGLFGVRAGDKEGITGTLENMLDIAERAVPVVREAAESVGTLARVLLAVGSGDTKGLDDKTKRLFGVANLIKEVLRLLAPRELGGTFGPGGIIQPILDILGIDFDASGIRKWVDAAADLLNPRSIFRRIKASVTGGDVAEGNPILDAIKSTFTSATEEAFSGAASIGTNIIDGIISGIDGGIQRVKDAASSMASGALQAAKDVLSIKSPSGAFRDEVGLQAAEGAALGFARGGPMVADAAGSMADGALRAAMADPWPVALPATLGAAPVGGALGLPGGMPFVLNYNPTFNITIQGSADRDIIAGILADEEQRFRERLTSFLRSRSGR